MITNNKLAFFESFVFFVVFVSERRRGASQQSELERALV
jgi:hypothetical protein